MKIYDYEIKIRLKKDTNISKGDFKADLRNYLKRPLGYKPDIYIKKKDINVFLDLLEDWKDIDDYDFINDVDTIQNLITKADLYKHIDTIDFYLSITDPDWGNNELNLLRHVNNDGQPNDIKALREKLNLDNLLSSFND